jgi:PAS domain S-box-containing protein
MTRDLDEAVGIDPTPQARDEEARLRAFARYADLEGGREEDFGDIVRLAALVCRTPLATIGLVDAGRLWHQAAFGFGVRRRVELRHSFSRFVIARGDLVVINDTREDPEFRDSPLVTGDPFFRFCAGAPLLAADGYPVGTLCVFDRVPRDLADEAALALKALARQCVSHLELRRSLRVAREADERLNLIFQSATDYAIVSVDPAGLITSWNAGARLIFGWAAEEVVGRHISLLYVPADRAAVPAEDLRHALANGREIHERYYARKDRSEFWGTGETMPLRAEDGMTRGYLKILRDRTTQKRIKEALEYQTGVLQAITDHLGEALFQVDVDHRITFMNPAAETMFGWSRYELLGVNLHDRLHHHPDSSSSHYDDCSYVIALKSRATLPRRADIFVHRDGRLLDVVVSFTPIVTEGVITGAVMTLTDVTETKKIEEALRRTQERYQLAVSASEIIGSWDWDLRARRVVADAIFAAQYGVDPVLAEKGAPLADFVAAIHPDDRSRVFAAVDASIFSRTQFAGEFRLRRPDGSVIWVSAHARCQYDARGRPVRYLGLSVDITERKRNEERRAALLELEDRLRNEVDTSKIAGLAGEIVCRLLDVTRAGFCAFDAAADYGIVERDFVRDGGQSLIGTHRLRDYGDYGAEIREGRLVVIDDVAQDARMEAQGARWRSLQIAAVVDAPLMAEGRLAGVFFVHNERPRRWSEDDIALIRNVSDRTWAAISRAQSVARQNMLTGELHHRIKNTMAMVQAIAGQTMRKAATKEDALSAFEARLMALSAAQDVLTRSSWSAATMAQIVEGALAPHRPMHADRISADGPEINLSPQSALSFVLAFHELATNATKYGALSNDAGIVTIRWTIEDIDGQPIFSCVWQEAGGPPVVPPSRKGFGSRLIKAGFSRAFSVDIDYAPDGLRTIFQASVAAL